MRHERELVSEHAMRLRTLATHCKFGAALDKEIERQFVVGCEMDEVQRKCSRTDNLDLATVLYIAMGFERVNASVNGLLHPLQFEETRRSSIYYTDSREAPKFLQKTNDRYSRQDQTFRGKDPNVQSNRSQVKSSQGSFMPQCGNCGRYAHSNGVICPARGVECKKCVRINHYAKVCRSNITAQAFNTVQGINLISRAA